MALKTLGFILSVNQDFKLLRVLKSHYRSQLRPLLEYCSTIWNPYTAEDRSMLVHRKFLKIFDFRFNIQCPPHDYKTIRKALSFSTLADFWFISNKNFLLKLLSGDIDSSSLLSQFFLEFHHINSSQYSFSYPFFY